MKVESWPIERVKPYPGNPRRNDGAVKGVAESLARFGWQQPLVVDPDGVLVIGHTRLRAAKHLGMTEVPVHVADLTPAQARALRIADNRTHEYAEWDMSKVAEAWRALPDELRRLTGFVAADLPQEAWTPPARAPLPRPGVTYLFEPADYEAVAAAVAKVRERAPDSPVGRCLELVCADYLAGPR